MNKETNVCNTIQQILKNCLIPKIQNSKGLLQFAKRRNNFEGWLKLELIDSFINNKFEALPEFSTKNIKNEEKIIDIKLNINQNDVLIELKTFCTNYDQNDENKIKINITDRIESVIKDIDKLKNIPNCKYMFILFVVLHTKDDDKKWIKHLDKIKNKATLCYTCCIKLKNCTKEIEGVIYLFFVNKMVA